MQLLGCKHIHTTSYHLALNGLIKRFHCQLKSAFKAHPNPIHLTDSLPTVLPGVLTQLKEDIHCTAAKLVYSTTLRLPVEFFDDSKPTTVPDPSCYVTRLKTIMSDL